MAILRLSSMFALFAIAAVAQTAKPAPASSPLAETPNTDIYYRLAPDALPQDGVPKGQIRGPFTLPSQAYPGTQHTYWIYVPAQYDPALQAGLMIYNDGQAFMAPEGDIRAPVVMDNLIYRREIPVMIGVFINPGRTPEQPEPTPALHQVRPPGEKRLRHRQQGHAEKGERERAFDRKLERGRSCDAAGVQPLRDGDGRPQDAMPGPRHEIVIEGGTRP